jgi:ribonucleoside-diphosphate reductase alpha chain
MEANIQFYDGIKKEQFHATLTKPAADLISVEHSDYQKLSARLAIFHLRKKTFGQYEPPILFNHITKLVGAGKYDKHLITDYTKAEFDEMDSFVVHDRDLNFSYAAIKQLEGNYPVQNRVTGEVFEFAQQIFVLIAACLFSKYSQDTRKSYIRKFYEAVSTFKFSLPTPIMSGVRTPTRQFSSCVLIEADDSLDSINAATSAIVKYVSQRAGIGINAGAIRALGSSLMRMPKTYRIGMLLVDTNQLAINKQHTFVVHKKGNLHFVSAFHARIKTL